MGRKKTEKPGIETETAAETVAVSEEVSADQKTENSAPADLQPAPEENGSPAGENEADHPVK